MNTVEFLRHVLADAGWICIDIKLNKGFRHRFFRTVEEAAAYALQQDALGHTVYFACATFETSSNRKQVNVAYLKSLWLDCDVGPDKPYKTRAEASAALTEFLATTGLPPPTIVHSGAGLHLYWVLDEPIPPERWKPLVASLRELCKQHGFHVDHSRTTDSASVLRPVGTHNRKQGSAEPVTVAGVAAPSWRGDLLLNSQRHPELHAQRQPAARPDSLLEHAAVYDESPSDAHKIAAECAQIGNLRDTKGNLSYDLWLYAIWTLHFTLQGDAIAHEWSSGHDKYTYEETQRKLDEATSPIKCATFAPFNDLCKSCRHWGKISTPLQLGRSVGRQQEQEGPHSLIRKTAATDVYMNDEHGLWLRSEKINRQGKTVPNDTLISKWPIYFDYICRGERDGDFSLMLTMQAPHIEGGLSIIIPTGIFFSAQGMPEMHRKGAVIHHPDYMRDYVRKQMDKYHAESSPRTQYSQFGWKDHDNAFLVGNKLYTQSQVLTVPGTPEVERRARLLGPRGGSLAAWTAAANKLFAVGCEPHSFALCCAFGALLMHFLSGEEGGAIINLVSSTSATGKTTGLEAIASVWGELNGVRLLDEDTQISRGVFLGTLGNLPCVFDELHKRDPDSVRQFVTMFTSGRDKLRARADGTLREIAGEWQTILVIGSNISLTDIIQTKNSEEAQAFRVLEFICEPTFTGHDGDKLRRELLENRGWAGDAFVRYLMQPGALAKVRADLDRAVAALWDQEYGFDKRHRFWVRALACALVAGRIVTHIGLLDFSASRVVAWAIERCKERKDSDTKRDNAQLLSEALYEIWASTLVVNVEWKPKTACMVLCAPSQNRSFLARRVRDSGRMYVMRTWLRKWLVDHNIDRTSFITDLKKSRVIVNENKFVTLGAGTDYNTGGQVVCFEIDLHHPSMMGALELAERAVPGDEKKKRPLSSILSPDAASPFPPSTLQ